MATATITYDGRNKLARSVMDFIRSLDVFTVTEAPKRKSGIEEALSTSHLTLLSDGSPISINPMYDSHRISINH